ncbi:formate dehydrogenase accessory sulfurtransferase FdhD [Oceanicola sp. S124]|uniref:formate dehydrogenase accessory sulfurtransferase FdhD n=1 Tax=Oceanicola sp. S124 TaxID=1042378 RepID=UPI0002557DBE|nr:formate dehydrogenase accessory sulfurtransferase FdhD [Oceanicola sp. S124]
MSGEGRTPPLPAASAMAPASRLAAGSAPEPTEHCLAAEVPVAVVFNGSTAAVMMASPQDLGDFALGFALTEGFITGAGDVESFELIVHDNGVEARFWVPEALAEVHAARRRAMMGPIGCGLCGIDSLDQALRDVPRVGPGVTLDTSEALSATEALRVHQPLHDRTHAIHAAGFLVPGQGLTCAREDVGRHNALDKLIGAVMAGGGDCAGGAIVLTSRVSVELVQKAAMAGCATLIAVSAPSLLAVRTAEAAGLTLVALSRRGAASVFCHPERLR